MNLGNLIESKFVSRYKRFFMNCKLETGEIVNAYTPNTGSMKSLLNKNNKVFLEFNDNPKRKLKYTTQLMQFPNEKYVCINTHLPNKIVFEAIINGNLKELYNFEEIKSEVKYGKENSRIDIWLKEKERECFIEVKNVTLVEDNLSNVGQFPDAKSIRGAKHLRELSKEVLKGNRGVMFYLIAREDINSFRVANHIDSNYKEEFDKAIKIGIEVLAYKIKIVKKEDNFEVSIGEKVKVIY